MERLSHGVLTDRSAALLDGDRPVDVLVGIPSFQNARTIGHVVRAVEAGLRKRPDRRCLIAISDGASPDGTVEAAMAATTEGDEELLLLDPKVERPDKLAMTYVGLSGKGSAFRAIFELAAAIGAAVLDADLRSVSPAWIDRLVGPVLERGYDLVTPLYARHKLDGTHHQLDRLPADPRGPVRAAAAPADRRHDLRRLLGPAGRPLGRQAGVEHADVAHFGVDIWMTTVALYEGFRVCQSVLGASCTTPRTRAATSGRCSARSWAACSPSPATTSTAGPRPTASPTSPPSASSTATSTEEIEVNLDALIWRFVEGYVAEHELWREVLAAQHFDGVKEAIHQASERPEGFVLPVELWARICYDYLLAYNAQVIDHDRLVSSMIAYFARTATFVREAADDSPEQAEERIAAFAEVFLAAKPYLIERWSTSGRPRRLGDQRVPGEDHRRGDDTSEFLAIGSP